MRKSGSVPLARARGIGPLPALLEKREGEKALVRAFHAAGLPLAVQETLDMPIPLAAMADLFAQSAREVGCRRFGLEVGESTPTGAYGSWAAHLVSGATLADGLRRACATSSAQLTGTQFLLERAGTHWAWRVIAPLGGHAAVQYTDHLIFPMLSLGRAYLGQHWRPDWIEVNYSRDPSAKLIEDHLRVPLRFDCRGVAIIFTPAQMQQKRPVDATPASSDDPPDIFADLVLSTSPEPVRSFSAIVAMRLLDGDVDIEGAARQAGVSLQGLQRRLRQSGSSYREVLERIRRSHAGTLLSQTSLPITEIAFRLGYEEHANFTRAFKRWTGCSPQRFRELNAD